MFSKLKGKKIKNTDGVALLMPGMNKMCDPRSFLPKSTFAPYTVSDVLWTFQVLRIQYGLIIISHHTFVGMSNVPFVNAGRQDRVELLGSFVVSY